MDVLDKIRKIEALIQRAATEGERQSAILARERLARIKEDEEIEYNISTQDMWHKRLFVAICLKHSLKPYRYFRQKYTTSMVRVSKSFLDGVVWPEYMEYSKMLEALVDDITSGIISKIHNNGEEVVVSGEIGLDGGMQND
ncbi:MAG: hypothetical protein ABIB71_03690 [Candidatus Woesearchaeota archaeon]